MEKSVQSWRRRAWSLNDFVRPRKHVRRNRQPDLFSRFQIDYELKLLRLLHLEIGWLGAFQNLVYVNCAAAPQIDCTDTVRHETSSLHRFANLIHYRNAIFYR